MGISAGPPISSLDLSADQATAAREAFKASCRALMKRKDVSGLTQPELAALRRFLERRQAIDDVPRSLLASDLAARLRPSVGGVGADLPPERFLELVAALRRIRT